MKKTWTVMLAILLIGCNRKSPAIVFITDFGLKDGAVSAMKGVVVSEDPELKLYDLTHEIPPYDIWEAAYRLEQTAAYWPEGTIFVSVVDPGVGTDRKSVVMRSRSGHYFVTPDNGTLTLVSRSLGIDAIREIDEAVNRRKDSRNSYTFHGRDVYAYTAARLASGSISFEDVGGLLPDSVISLPFESAQINGETIIGGIPVLDIEYGNVWTNIPDSLIRQLKISNNSRLQVKIYDQDRERFSAVMPFVTTFGAVAKDSVLAYSNSLLQVAFGVNQGNFAEKFKVESGPEWKVAIKCVEGCK